MIKQIRKIMFLILAVVLLTAPSVLAQEKTGIQEVSITGDIGKLSFNPNKIYVTAGKPVKITVKNVGKKGLVFEIRGITRENWIVPGGSKTFNLTFRRGTYTFYEENMGSQGMNGKIIAR